jgi:hypothetical protein
VRVLFCPLRPAIAASLVLVWIAVTPIPAAATSTTTTTSGTVVIEEGGGGNNFGWSDLFPPLGAVGGAALGAGGAIAVGRRQVGADKEEARRVTQINRLSQLSTDATQVFRNYGRYRQLFSDAQSSGDETTITDAETTLVESLMTFMASSALQRDPVLRSAANDFAHSVNSVVKSWREKDIKKVLALDGKVGPTWTI